MAPVYDLIIVGGGIGGSALAQVMASAGRSVLLLEQSELYQDRVRGPEVAPPEIFTEAHRARVLGTA